MNQQILINARDALMDRFAIGEVQALQRRPYRDVLWEARCRRAAALDVSRWEETPEANRETPVIRALHAAIVEFEAHS